MKKTRVTKTEGSSADLDAIFDNARPIDELNVKGLAQAFAELDHDPAFIADTIKGVFVEDVLRALDQSTVSKSELARRMGKSRQQINILLDEEKKNNFTIETMAKVSTALSRKLFVRMLAADEQISIDRCVVPQTAPRPKLQELLTQNWTQSRVKLKLGEHPRSKQTQEDTDNNLISFPTAA